VNASREILLLTKFSHRTLYDIAGTLRVVQSVVWVMLITTGKISMMQDQCEEWITISDVQQCCKTRKIWNTLHSSFIWRDGSRNMLPGSVIWRDGSTQRNRVAMPMTIINIDYLYTKQFCPRFYSSVPDFTDFFNILPRGIFQRYKIWLKQTEKQVTIVTWPLIPKIFRLHFHVPQK
jgi:hypothetical protein